MKIRAFLLAFLLPVSSLSGQLEDACGERFREFDFGVGSWTVWNQAGTTVQGTSSITLTVSDCTVREAWTSGGGRGWSLNMFDPVRGDWTQVWMDDSDLELHLQGGLVDGAMVLEGSVGGQLQRVTWTPLDDGRVRQHWQVSSNGGASWSTSFDGYYVRQ